MNSAIFNLSSIQMSIDSRTHIISIQISLKLGCLLYLKSWNLCQPGSNYANYTTDYTYDTGWELAYKKTQADLMVLPGGFLRQLHLSMLDNSPSEKELKGSLIRKPLLPHMRFDPGPSQSQVAPKQQSLPEVAPENHQIWRKQIEKVFYVARYVTQSGGAQVSRVWDHLHHPTPKDPPWLSQVWSWWSPKSTTVSSTVVAPSTPHPRQYHLVQPYFLECYIIHALNNQATPNRKTQTCYSVKCIWKT